MTWKIIIVLGVLLAVAVGLAIEQRRRDKIAWAKYEDEIAADNAKPPLTKEQAEKEGIIWWSDGILIGSGGGQSVDLWTGERKVFYEE